MSDYQFYYESLKREDESNKQYSNVERVNYLRQFYIAHINVALNSDLYSNDILVQKLKELEKAYNDVLKEVRQ